MAPIAIKHLTMQYPAGSVSLREPAYFEALRTADQVTSRHDFTGKFAEEDK